MTAVPDYSEMLKVAIAEARQGYAEGESLSGLRYSLEMASFLALGVIAGFKKTILPYMPRPMLSAKRADSGHIETK